MNNFKDFGIRPSTDALSGEKIKIQKVLNCPIEVIEWRLAKSQYPDSSEKYLQLQIRHEDKLRVIFTGSGVLIEMIQKVPKEKFPFMTKIVEDNDRYMFT